VKKNISKKNIPQNYIVLQGNDKLKSSEILVVVIDPHADGKLAVSKFDSFCKNNNCTVIGLTDVQNDDGNFLLSMANHKWLNRVRFGRDHGI